MTLYIMAFVGESTVMIVLLSTLYVCKLGQGDRHGGHAMLAAAWMRAGPIQVKQVSRYEGQRGKQIA